MIEVAAASGSTAFWRNAGGNGGRWGGIGGSGGGGDAMLSG